MLVYEDVFYAARCIVPNHNLLNRIGRFDWQMLSKVPTLIT